jgi:predicted small secreted protein
VPARAEEDGNATVAHGACASRECCNTVSGLGKDLQTVGGVMTKTAEEAK